MYVINQLDDHKDHYALRKKVADYLEVNINNAEVMAGIVAQLPKQKTVKEYIEAIRNSNEWADNLEIVTLMHVFNRPIIVIGASDSVRNMGDIDRFSGEPIFVYYNGHNHYDALIVKEGFTAQGILNQLKRQHNIPIVRSNR